MNETSLFAQAVQTVVPEPCYTKLFTDFNFFDVDCAKIIISKCLGFAIILGSILVKLPQILKISSSKSGEGISLLSVLLELIAISANASYSFRKEFPFSSYGEGVFLMLQTSLVLFLVIYYGSNALGAFGFIVVYTATIVNCRPYVFSSYGEGVFLMLQTSLVLFLVIYYGGNVLGVFGFIVVYTAAIVNCRPYVFISYGEGVFLMLQTSLVLFLVIYYGGNALGAFGFIVVYTATIVNCQPYVFSSYGEGVFLMLQTSLVLFLVIYYGGNALGAFGFIVVYTAAMAFLVSPAAPMSLLSGFQGINILIVIASKLLQIVANLRNGGTGQLSAVTLAMVFLGSVARILTSIQETGDTLIIVTYVASSVFNGVLMAQIVYYWNKKKTD